MKVAIITGADGAMGYEESKAVAQQGYHLVMACYCPALAQEKCERLRQETGNSNIEVIGLDLSSLALVRRFADEVKSRFQHIDLLMNNAGTMETGKHITVDGIERTVAVNYVGPYLLTRLLLPLMGEGSRIVCMSSVSYHLGSLKNLNAFFSDGRKGWWQRVLVYASSKLAVTLFVFKMAERLRGTGVTINAADPGVVDTPIIGFQMFFDPITDLVFRPFIRTPREGADTAIRLLLDADKAALNGTFCRSGRPVDLGKKYTQHKQLDALWERTEEIVQAYL
ncbi:MAG: SDR family NAD(P)-dependent oxidoreductase [Bacteroidaceae bacterium]|nr:SDR family NAD(P)-dependent oxidoreductase [Bacteroidaceae bacterium]